MDQKPKCPICQGTGFAKGKICRCITGKKPEGLPDMPDLFKDIFGGGWDVGGGWDGKK